MVESFRRSRARWWLFACVGGFFFIGISAALVHDPKSPISTAARGMYGLLAISSLLLMVRVARAGIYVDTLGVLIRNYLRTYRVAWRDISGFEPPAAYGRLRNAGLRVCKIDGGYVCSSLFAAGPLNRPGFADDVLQRLNSLRDQYGHG